MDTEDNLDELVEMVFSKPPQTPKSIQLQLDEGNADESVIPETFAHIASRGAKRLFRVTNIMQSDRGSSEHPGKIHAEHGRDDDSDL